MESLGVSGGRTELGDACAPGMISGAVHSPAQVRKVLLYVTQKFAVPVLMSFVAAEDGCDVDGERGHTGAELLCAMEAMAVGSVPRHVLEALVRGCA